MSERRHRFAVAAECGAAALQKYRPGHQAVALLKELSAIFYQSPKPESAKQPKGEWASMKSEITRKALTALVEAQSKQMDGRLNGRDLWVIADALYDTTSGLVDPDISALLYRARQELKEHAPQ